MSEESAPVAETVSYAVPADAPAAMTVSEAARMLSLARRQQAEPPAESAQQATAEEPPLAEKADTDPLQEAPGDVETQVDEPAEELPPIDPPRSWTKEEKEAFAQWPREAQESVARVASTREAEFRRSQNEAAEARKALDAEHAQAKELTKAMAAKLPELEKAVRDYVGRQYPEFKSAEDVVNYARQAEALAQSDPFTSQAMVARLTAWREDQQNIALQLAEAREADQKLKLSQRSDWAKYIKSESDAFEEDVPEFAAKKDEYTKKAGDMLRELGFKDEELAKLVSGEEKIALFDRRMQRLLFDRVRLSEIKAATAKAIPKPVPPVQRPGVKQGGNPSTALQIQNLESQLSKATGNAAIRLAAELTQAKRKAAAR